jgi:hypothetical protein
MSVKGQDNTVDLNVEENFAVGNFSTDINGLHPQYRS